MRLWRQHRGWLDGNFSCGPCDDGGEIARPARVRMRRTKTVNLRAAAVVGLVSRFDICSPRPVAGGAVRVGNVVRRSAT